MPEERPGLSERVLQRISRLLDQAEEALDRHDWTPARDAALAVLGMDPTNADAQAFMAAAQRALAGTTVASPSTQPSLITGEGPSPPGRQSAGAGVLAQPKSFCDGRYQVKRFLGEGGKKRVYLAHDAKLDRDVAFAVIKTDGLDAEGEARIRREAQAMGRLGDHPHIVAAYDIGDEEDQPYLVSQLMAGGDVEGLIEHAPDHRVPLDQALRIADQVCQALEHAHGHGIVHRDLKPGNVWLTADGTAKLGDFGLAVALDRSRLTQAGMMVGTVSYMPPEQALGGEVTPRSDLYSLGAMLYELVTGRPPFIGDESVAIITQHLNTPPVSPSWHRPDCPPGLEALILRLLEKNATRRPASAAEVSQALVAIARGQLPTGTGQVATSTQLVAAADPLYRGTFVGREVELRQLQAAFDGALSGRGALAAVVGEPGIGKTALCEQLATYVAVRGGKTLVGHCYEEGSLSLPYLPFIEALRGYVLSRDPDELRAELGSSAGEVARIVSELRDRLHVEPRPAGGDPEEDRWRLLQAVTGFLRSAAAVQPLFVVLEDLHWADRGSLDLLLHLARNLAGTRLLVVGTYRDVEVDRAHPLSGTLAELRRSASFLRISLRGLTVDEVHRMMNIIRGQDVPWGRAEAIHRQTEGNPLFVQEVLRYLVEEGLVVRAGDHYERTDGTDPDAGIPEGLRDVIGKRLSRLSEKTNQALAVAAVIGREFRLDVLQAVAGLPEDDLYAALEEATERAVVENRSTIGAMAFRFTHAFFRQTLYEEIFPPRRIRFHQQIGRALEAIHARRPEEHAAEMADHFAQSTEREDLEKALRYSELAAKRSLAVVAYGEAVRHLERALQVQDVLDPDDQTKRCDLLLALGESMLPLEDPAKIAPTVGAEAFTLAEALRDTGRAARAALLACEGILRSELDRRGITVEAVAGRLEWAARAERYTPAGTGERLYADVYQALALVGAGRIAEAHELLRSAAALAFELDENALLFVAAGFAFRNLRALRDQELVERLAHEVEIRPREGVRTQDLGLCLYFAAEVQLQSGDRKAAERLWEELAALAERTHDISLAVMALAPPAKLAYLDGQVERALTLCEVAAARAEELGVAPTVNPAWLELHVGPVTDETLKAWENPSRPVQAARCLILARLGRHEEARALRERFGNIGAEDDESGMHNLLLLFEAAILGSDHPTARTLSRRLAPFAQTLSRGYLFGFVHSNARLLGDAAALLDEPEAARAYYQQALQVCARVRHRPEAALTHLALAELLLAGAPEQRAEAQGHLDFAIDELRAMKMQPALERALRHKGLLHA